MSNQLHSRRRGACHLTLFVTSPVGAVRTPDSALLLDGVRLLGGGGGGAGDAPGLVDATGAGGEGVEEPEDRFALCRGGGGGEGATGGAPNLLSPLEEKFAAAAATLPRPGVGLSFDVSADASDDASGVYMMPKWRPIHITIK